MTWENKMTQQQQNGFAGNLEIQQHYLDIINCMPNIVYWIDLDCNLQGCNLNFVNLLGLEKMKDFSGTPYDTISRKLPWTPEQIAALKMDDMAVLFLGEPKYEVEEAPVCNKAGESIYYLSSRVPLLDAGKNVIGLVVILVDITAQKAMQKQLNLGVKQEDGKSMLDAERVGAPLKVLLVEDSPIAQSHERSIFAALNCDVDIAETGDAAAELFSPGKYALVLMDIGLENTSGYIVTKAFRQQEKNTEHHVPIIALTQYIADKVTDDCHYYGMEGVITKPLAKEQALQIIKRYACNEDIVVEGLHSK